MIPLEVRNFIEQNFYKIQGKKHFIYYNKNDKKIKLSEIINELEFNFENFKICKLSVMKNIPIRVLIF